MANESRSRLHASHFGPSAATDHRFLSRPVQIETRVLLPSAFRLAIVGRGNSRMRVFCVPNGFTGAGSNSIMRGQRQLFPEWNWNKRRKGDAAPSSWSLADSVTHPSLHAPRPCISLAASSVEANRYTLRIEIAVTPGKQTTVVLSNRYKKPPPGGVASWLPHRQTHCISALYTMKVEFAVNPSWSTT